MSLGFRKNDYRSINSDQIESISNNLQESYGPPLSEITEQQDIVWDIWDNLIKQTSQLGVPILDECKYPDLLRFLMGNDPYTG